VICRELPAGAIGRRIEPVSDPQMPAQGGRAKSAFQADDMVWLHRSPDRHCRCQFLRCRCGRRRICAEPAQCLMHGCNQSPELIDSDLPTARVMAVVPAPSAVRTMIRARQTCFCGLLRSRMIDCKRARSAGVTSTVIPLRMPHSRTAGAPGRTKNMDSSVRYNPLVCFGLPRPSCQEPVRDWLACRVNRFLGKRRVPGLFAGMALLSGNCRTI
jgi:hypothetical protein